VGSAEVTQKNKLGVPCERDRRCSSTEGTTSLAGCWRLASAQCGPNCGPKIDDRLEVADK
jgi:hypothetical protein